jgi:hypothetical protein
MTDDELDPALREQLRGYRLPPAPPRDAMWARIQAARAAETRTSGPIPLQPNRRRLLPYLLAAAALGAVAFGLGRLTARPDPVVASRTAPDKSTLAEQLATGEHLGRVEVFLTTFRAAARNGQAGTISAADARRLLSTTRLFLDSPGGQDPRLRPLLEDLELVLAEITQLPGSTPDDLNLITEGLDRSGTLSRLRSAVPAGQTPVSQGES